MVSQFAPAGEDGELLTAERTTMAGVALMCVAYGMEVMLWYTTSQLLLKQRITRQNFRILIYIFVLFALATISTGCAIKVQIWDWVDNREFPGGPFIFSFTDGRNPVYLTELMAFNLMSFLQDGWLLYRFWIIWNRNWFVIVLPFLLYLSSMATTTLLWVQILISGAPFLSASHIDLGLIVWVLSISTNLVLTALIVLRILVARRGIRSTGSATAQQLKTCMSVGSMLVESQAIYAVIGILVLIGVKTSTSLVNVLANTFGIMEAFAPTLVAYRVVKGTAWRTDTYDLSSVNPLSAHTNHTIPHFTMTNASDIGMSPYRSTNGHSQDSFHAAHEKSYRVR